MMRDLQDIARQILILIENGLLSLYAKISHEQVSKPVPAEPGNDTVIVFIFTCIVRNERMDAHRRFDILLCRDHFLDLHDL